MKAVKVRQLRDVLLQLLRGEQFCVFTDSDCLRKRQVVDSDYASATRHSSEPAQVVIDRRVYAGFDCQRNKYVDRLLERRNDATKLMYFVQLECHLEAF